MARAEAGRARDPERTRARILTAAEKEFSAKGFAGARVDAIARRARVNKRMLYHYFGNKEELYRGIMRQKLGHAYSPFRFQQPETADLAEHLVLFNQVASSQSIDFVRLMQWEALTTGNRKVIGEEERRRRMEEMVEHIRRDQAGGVIPADLDAGQWLLSLLALNAFPIGFPQITRLITGLSPSDPEFRRQRIAFLRRLAAYLQPQPAVAEPNQQGGEVEAPPEQPRT